MLNYGERLKDERVRLGYNQNDLAAIGGVAKTSQFNYEKGDRRPDTDYLAAVASVGVDVLYVVTGQRAPLPATSFSAADVELLGKFNQLSADDKATVQRVLDALLQSK